MLRIALRRSMTVSFGSLLLMSYAAPASAAQEDPVVTQSRTSSRLEALPRLPISKRKVVTVYEFRTGVAEIENKALTDMFTNALVKSGAFLVAERERLVPDIANEKSLNAKGMSGGDSANQKLAAAQYIFEGTVSESNPDENSSEGGVSVGGMEIGGRTKKGSLAIDVRVVDAGSGLVLDSVDVSKKIEASGKRMSGIGNLAQSLGSMVGAGSIPLNPDASFKTGHNESVDRALRACIETAVLELVQRYARD